MIVYVIKMTCCGEEDAIIGGAYSNLALAGHAAMQYINEIMKEDNVVITFRCYEEPWGYYLDLNERSYGDSWQFGTLEIIRVTVNE